MLCGSLVACSQAMDYTPPAFHPEQVSCSDVSSLQLRSEYEAIVQNPGGDLYAVRHIGQVLQTMRKLADSGNIQGMLSYGDMAYEYQYLLHQDDIRQKKDFVFPASTKAKLVDAMTYLSLATLIDNPNADAAEHLRKEIIEFVPTEWAVQAKANANAWKSHCGM